MYKPRPILKTYYDALEHGKILGMECQDCSAISWPPLPTCQSCTGTNVEWRELTGEAAVVEFSFVRENPGSSGSFLKGNPYFVSNEPYCLCTGTLKEGVAFNAALFGVSAANVDSLTQRLPLDVTAEFIQLADGFKSVGFRVPE